MPGLLSRIKNKSDPRSTTTQNVARHRYTKIGVQQVRLLQYASDSTPDQVRLQIQVFDRRTKPQYAAMSYVWGDRDPKQIVRLNGCDFEIGPNLHSALLCMRNGLSGWFWIDAICIDQQNKVERNEQVSEMTQTYANAAFVASWVGLCNESLLPAFSLDVRSSTLSNLPRNEQEKLHSSLTQLSRLNYWKRIWIQQEVLLNPNVILFCGHFNQPLHPLIQWTENQDRQGKRDVTTIGIFWDLSQTIEWFSYRKAPVLRLLTWAGATKQQSTDPKDKLYALLSQVVEHEREGLRPYFPDYRLTLSRMLMVTLVHIRRFAGQRRAALQLDSVLLCFGDPGDSACGDAVRGYYWDLKEAAVGTNGTRSLSLACKERRSLKNMKLLKNEINVLDVCDCIFAQETGPIAGTRADVRSSRTWQRSRLWVFDAELPQDLNQYWFGSHSRD
jgi:hypothetical protein